MARIRSYEYYEIIRNLGKDNQQVIKRISAGGPMVARFWHDEMVKAAHPSDFDQRSKPTEDFDNIYLVRVQVLESFKADKK